MRDKAPSYNIARIRALLTEVFTARDLDVFLRDRPPLKPILNRYGPNTGLDERVDEVIVYCEKRWLFDTLLDEVQTEFPQQFAAGAPYGGSGAASSPLPDQAAAPAGGMIPGLAGNSGPVNIYINQVGQMSTGDTFNLSGDFRGAMLNIKSVLDGAQQSINAMPPRDAELQEQLRGLVSQLEQSLRQPPPDKIEQAQAVAECAKNVVDAAALEKPDRAKVKISADGLKRAAENLAGVMPAVTNIALQIVSAISRAAGAG